MKRKLVMGGLVLIALGGVGFLVVLSGVIPIKASAGHWDITAWFLDFAKERSVATHSMGTKVPSLDEPGLTMLGAGHYEGACRLCHGAPGAARGPIAMAMTPHPPQLAAVVREHDDAELHYIVLHGIKMTGMPAWPALEREDEVWAVVAFLRQLPEMDHDAYRALVHDDSAPFGAPEIVRDVCARCHGFDGLGRGAQRIPRLAGQRPVYLAKSIGAYARGNRHSGIMEPIAAALSGEQARAAVDWYASLPPPPPSAAEHDERGEQIAARGIPEQDVPSCTDCHGPGHEPRHEAYPLISGQPAWYLERQLELFDAQTRGGTEYAAIMENVTAHQLDPEVARAVSRYYASQSAE